MDDRKITRVLVGGIAAILIGIACLPQTRAAYHLWRLKSLNKSVFSNPIVAPVPGGSMVSYGSGNELERMDYHRERLVGLGVLFRKEYQLEQLDRLDYGWHVFNHLFVAKYGQYPAVPTVYGQSSIEVWGYTENLPEWDAWVEELNAADFLEQNAELIESIRIECAQKE